MIHQVVGNVGVGPTLPGEIRSTFPVSSGVQHRQKEHTSDGTKNEPVFDAAGQVTRYARFSRQSFRTILSVCLYWPVWPVSELVRLQLRSYIPHYSFVNTMLRLEACRLAIFAEIPFIESSIEQWDQGSWG